MNNKKTGALTIILIVVSLFAFFSCKQSGESSKGDGIIEITVMHHQDITSPEAKVEEEIFKAFEEAHPNIKLKFETYFGEAYHQKVKAMAAAGKLSDVIYLWPGGRSRELTKNGLIADLYPFLGNDKKYYVESAIAPQGDGKLYELPQALTATHVLYTNTKLLDELGLEKPKTLNDMMKMVPIARENGLDLVIMPNKPKWVNQSCLFSTVVGRIAGENWAIDAKNGKASFTDPKFVESLRIIEQMYQTGILPRSSIQLDYGDSPNLFAENKGIFMIDGDWRVNALTPLISVEDQKHFDLDVIPSLPGQIGADGSTSVVPGTGLGMREGLSKEKAEAAWKLIYWYAGPVAAKIRLEQQGVIPAYKVDLSKFELPPLAQKRGDFYASHGPTPVLDNVFEGVVIEEINTGLQLLGLGESSPEEIAQDIAKKMNK